MKGGFRLDTMLNISKHEDCLVDSKDDNFRVTHIKIHYQGVGLGKAKISRVLEFPKLLWRKIYSIFTTQNTSDNDDCHTISIEGLSTLTESQVVVFARELRKQMDAYAGYSKPAKSRDYDHTFLVTLEYYDISTNIISSDVVTRWVTNDGDVALKTWNEWVQLEAIYSSGNLIPQLP
jgi:hypothetical protein